jgi:hypothetical protein
MAIQGNFEVYLPYVMMMLVGASQARAPSSVHLSLSFPLPFITV